MRLAYLLKDSSLKYEDCHLHLVPTPFGLLSFGEHKHNYLIGRIHVYKSIFGRIICKNVCHCNDPCLTEACFPVGGPQNLQFIRLSKVNSITTPKEFIQWRRPVPLESFWMIHKEIQLIKVNWTTLIMLCIDLPKRTGSYELFACESHHFVVACPWELQFLLIITPSLIATVLKMFLNDSLRDPTGLQLDYTSYTACFDLFGHKIRLCCLHSMFSIKKQNYIYRRNALTAVILYVFDSLKKGSYKTFAVCIGMYWLYVVFICVFVCP